MPLIKWLEQTKHSKIGLTIGGLILTTLSFYLLNLTSWIGILAIGMLFVTVGEMIGFPFSNAFAMDRAKKGKSGEYLSMYVMAFAIANVFGHSRKYWLRKYLVYYGWTWNNRHTTFAIFKKNIKIKK